MFKTDRILSYSKPSFSLLTPQIQTNTVMSTIDSLSPPPFLHIHISMYVSISWPHVCIHHPPTSFFYQHPSLPGPWQYTLISVKKELQRRLHHPLSSTKSLECQIQKTAEKWLTVVPISTPKYCGPPSFLRIASTCYRVHEGILAPLSSSLPAPYPKFLQLMDFPSPSFSFLSNPAIPVACALLLSPFRLSLLFVLSLPFLSHSLYQPLSPSLLALFSLWCSLHALDSSRCLRLHPPS